MSNHSKTSTADVTITYPTCLISCFPQKYSIQSLSGGYFYVCSYEIHETIHDSSSLSLRGLHLNLLVESYMALNVQNCFRYFVYFCVMVIQTEISMTLLTGHFSVLILYELFLTSYKMCHLFPLANISHGWININHTFKTLSLLSSRVNLEGNILTYIGLIISAVWHKHPKWCTIEHCFISLKKCMKLLILEIEEEIKMLLQGNIS